MLDRFDVNNKNKFGAFLNSVEMLPVIWKMELSLSLCHQS